MGLSAEERVLIAYDAVAAIQREREALEAARPPEWETAIPRMRACVDGLWHALLAGKGNLGRWMEIIGDSGPVDALDGDPMSVALSANVSQMRAPDGGDVSFPESDFDAMKRFLSVADLIRERDAGLAAVFRVYELSEKLAYGAVSSRHMMCQNLIIFQ